jgi:3',5'-cyclic-AMP phosphodiesterase
MPMSLSPISRRRFLRVVGAGVGWLAVRPSFATDADAHRVALLSDTHIPDAAERDYQNYNMTERLRRVVKEVAALDPRPVCAVINGDLAWKLGTPGEYARFAAEIEPLQKLNVPLHLTLGNHDARTSFLADVKAAQPKDRPVDGKHVLVVELPRADLVLLDSLEPRLGTAGECGAAQLKWLGQALDRNATKPALVFVHHNPQWSPPEGKAVALVDTMALWDVLKSHPRVKAHFFGHTHSWRLDKKDGIHLVNLPAVGYPFQPNELTGWVDMRLTDKGAELTIRSLDIKHAQHMKTTELAWR